MTINASLMSSVCTVITGLFVTACTQVPGDPSLNEMQQPAAAEVPIFQVDPSWPKQLPNNWIVGVVSGIAVDGRDHIWILQRPGSLEGTEILAASDPPAAECCVPAPPVLEIDADGNVVQAWAGRVPNMIGPNGNTGSGWTTKTMCGSPATMRQVVTYSSSRATASSCFR